MHYIQILNRFWTWLNFPTVSIVIVLNEKAIASIIFLFYKKKKNVCSWIEGSFKDPE